jgi:anti-sigma B factor antagonist
VTLRISQRQVGNVTILDLTGRLGLGEEDACFRDTIKQLLREGKTQILLNLTDLFYVQSSSIGEMVSAFTSAHLQGGTLKLVSLTKKVHDLLQITKLYTVFEVFDAEEDALKSFEASLLYCLCPVCQERSRPPLLDLRLGWPPQTCDHCGAQFEAHFLPGSRQQAVVKSLRLQIYENNPNEYVQILSGPPFTLEVAGRLELFAQSALHKAWQSIPAPRFVLVDLRQATEVSDAGRDALLALMRNSELAKSALSLEGLGREQVKGFPREPPVYAKKAAALAALGDTSDAPAWRIQWVRTSQAGSTTADDSSRKRLMH